jgi:chitin synthase
MYLAEDRIFCLQLFIKKGENYILQYLPGCKAITDPPYNIIGLILQRRRWVNGSLFASYHVFWSLFTLKMC